MSKANYNRNCLTENLLRKVLLRVDYAGVTDIIPWIDSIKKDFTIKYFGNYSRVQNNNINITITNPNEVAPVSEMTKELIHRFSDSKFKGLKDSVQLDISNFYTTLLIDCKEYQNIDPYVDFLVDLLSLLLEYDSYIKIKRIGIRKWSGDIFPTEQEIFKVYEKKILNQYEYQGISMISQTYTDQFFRQSPDVKINNTRLYGKIVMDQQEQVQVLLDMDGYVDEQIINKNQYDFPRQLKDILMGNINDYLFELFKDSVQETYLHKHGKRI